MSENWDDVVRDLRVRSARTDEAREPRGRHRGSLHPTPVRPRRRRSFVVGVVLTMVLVIALWSWTRHGAAPAPAASRAPTGSAAAWRDVLAGLDAARVTALSDADPDALRTVDVDGSAAARADRAAVQRLRREGVRPHGLRVDLDTVGVVRVSAGSVRLRVVDRRSAYVLVDGAGRTARSVPARGPRAWSVELRPSGQAWRIAAVRPIA